MNEKTEPMTAEALMGLVSEYGQCRWSEGSSGATYLDRMGERRSREEAADLFAQIETAVAALAASPSSKSTKEADKLHAAIMNLPANRANSYRTTAERFAYVAGHRDARHAAAELALASSSIKEDGERA